MSNGDMYEKTKTTYEILWYCVSFKLRLDAQSLHKLPHAISSEIDEHQCVAVCEWER